ncbi:RNA-binding protein 25 [Babesia sp. Xinjiang]|uniref:RNA-binding protein 25 n=1 Tax=Babesia sp. Xinjiang TaxID=462227 RepID=UPI000A228611|nr:RNA-binding protein 25 [Babesia sp. Xinjiang]ORM41407.1 RNA-binding protein 25 [Babesia sp. Xinjiang]
MSSFYPNGMFNTFVAHQIAAPLQQGYGATPPIYPPQPPVPGTMIPPCPPPVQRAPGVMDVPGHTAVIAKGPSAPTAPVGYSSSVVPGLMDTLMMPATVSLPAQEPDPPPMVNVVYVGGLHSGTSSDFVINIMQKCGKLINFKRHADPSSGLLANFALCEFESPKGAYYALECLANLTFGDGQIKVSCNDKVRGLVDGWVSEQLEALREENPNMNDDQLREIFKAPEAELRHEFENLIKYEVMEMQGRGMYGGQQGANVKGVTLQPSRKPHTPRNETSAIVRTADSVNDLSQLTSREYTIHPKESARRSKFKARQRANDDLMKSEERAWESEEESMIRKLHRIGTVKRSTRERLVKEDLDGFARSAGSREREKERELDLEDAQAEALELSTSEARCTIPLATPAVPQVPAEANRRALPTIFGTAVEEDEPMFNRSHRPKIKLGIPDSEVWDRVPKSESEVFGFDLDWGLVLSDGSLIPSLEPWMRRCVLEYMGDDESVAGEVLEFLVGRLMERPNHEELLSDVEQFLDEDSRGFILELWRHLIFHHLRLSALSSD